MSKAVRVVTKTGVITVSDDVSLQRLIDEALAAAEQRGREAEREECAKVAKCFTSWMGNAARKSYNQGRLECAIEIAYAIRARAETGKDGSV